MVTLSVIIPIYKTEAYIDQCVQSVLDQTFKDYEIILVDDGSPDRCPDICDAYDTKFDNITALHKENGGLSSARNAGIEHASGEYLLFLDSDDMLIGEDALALISQSLKQTHPDVLLYSETEYDEDFRNVIIRHDTGNWDENVLYRASDVIDTIYRDSVLWITQCVTKIIRRDFLLENRLWFIGGIYHEDDIWTAKTFLSEPDICFLKKHLYAYRHRNASIMSTTDRQIIYKKACDKVKIGAEMLSFENAKHYRDYMKYVSEYFLNSFLSYYRFEEEQKAAFIRYVNPYRRYGKKVIYSKCPRLIVKAAYLYLFGVKRYISFYAKKLRN